MNRLVKYVITMGLFVALTLPVNTNAQPNEGQLGLTTNGSGVSASYMLSNNLRVNAGLNLGFGDDYTMFGINGGAWLYQPAQANLATYLGGGFNFTSTSSGPFDSSNLTLNAVYGAEYFIASSFSANVHLRTDLDFDPFRIGFGTGMGLTWWIQ
ncbi:MAG: hypothetical protein K9N46_11830 [Candidatus Marinimicrobia bacterium]|nr:hypothetical protein [Candidatus Neomarinimicrobiota bacterium]MCF7827349.1 hypothetical protein [Candidatus Neomarinimicrobiota bacterium]MCF7881418.1 hypothetical protein [Candidatus Neomarinimicrobiota bacterium]